MYSIKYVLYLVAVVLMAPVQAQDWSSQWQTIMQDVWQNTKVLANQAATTTADLAKQAKERFNPKAPVEIGIAYGTEKQKWLKWAVDEFAKTDNGKKIKINLIPMGSIEGADAVLKQDKRIHVWSPASGLVRNLLVEPWQKEHGKDPIASDAPLALSPMVIVMWADRYEAFIAKYSEVNFKTIAEALNEQTGWAAIASKPEWGPFNFGHTSPEHSNSGLLTLVLMAYDYAGVVRDVKPAQIMDAGFLTWLETMAKNTSHDEKSTGTLMNAMLQRGPSEFSGVVTYEHLALDNLKVAEGRWGKIKVVYPTRSAWNDNPYYVLDVPWSNQEQKDAAELFRDFLLSVKAQQVARDEYLFRPASLELPILDEKSAFTKLQDVVKIDVTAIRAPSAEVLNQLLQVWKKIQ